MLTKLALWVLIGLMLLIIFFQAFLLEQKASDFIKHMNDEVKNGKTLDK